MKTYTKEQFVKDFIAGIIVAIIALPLYMFSLLKTTLVSTFPFSPASKSNTYLQ
jgi:uncharacterized membrane protein